jgi:hypothetical protein
LVVASILVPLAYAAAQPKAKAPAVVLSVAGADALLGDVVYLTETAGVGDVGRLAALMATPYTTCLDKDKPLGVCLSVEDGRPMGMAFVPVKDLKLLLAALKAQVGEPKELDNGVFEIAGDKPQPVFIRQRGIWAFVSNSRDSLANVPEDPVGLLGGLNKEYTIAARVNVQSIPEEIRKMAVEQVRRGFAEGMQKNLPDRQREVAKKIGESWVKTIVSLIQDVEFVTLGFKADAKTQKTFLDFSVTAVAGTELAKQMALTQSGPSAFAGFLTSNGAVNLHVNAKSSADDIEQAVALLALVREEAGKGIDRDGNLGDADRATARRIVGQLLDVAEESIKAGNVNLGASLFLEAGSLAFVGGGFVADGKKLESAVRALSEFATQKDPGFPGVNFNAGTHGGVTLHTVSVPLGDAKRQAREILGDPMEVVLGVGAKSVFLALGKNPAPAMKKVIDASRANASQKQLPFELNVALKPILQFASTVDSNPAVKQALEKLQESNISDRVALTAQPVERGFGLRLSVDEGVIKVIGEAARAAQPGARR